jgi:endonuclease/exonuclease/phosphatase family metal-dependent hydrolase
MAHIALISLNCFGVPTPTTNRRLLTLAQALNHAEADVVCLQEVQLHRYNTLLQRACSAYPYHAVLPFVHAPKGGLLTLGRVPFDHAYFTIYHERGLWYTPGITDWILHKGVLATRLQVERLPIVVLNTHLNANYDGNWSHTNRFAQSEWRQLQQLAEVVQAQPAEALVIVAGDFNVPRQSWLYNDFLERSGLVDALAGDTRATYRSLPGLPRRLRLPIDFILYRAPVWLTLYPHADLLFQEKVPFVQGGGTGYLSDHCGVVLRLAWELPAAHGSCRLMA